MKHCCNFSTTNPQISCARIGKRKVRRKFQAKLSRNTEHKIRRTSNLRFSKTPRTNIAAKSQTVFRHPRSDKTLALIERTSFFRAASFNELPRAEKVRRENDDAGDYKSMKNFFYKKS